MTARVGIPLQALRTRAWNAVHAADTAEEVHSAKIHGRERTTSVSGGRQVPAVP